MISKTQLWGGRALSTVAVGMLLLSATMKLMGGPDFDKAATHMGWSVGQMQILAYLELACTLLYLIPQTTILGAVLLTGYLGGATATHVRVGDPWIAPVLLGVFLWLGLYLRDLRLRPLLFAKK